MSDIAQRLPEVFKVDYRNFYDPLGEIFSTGKVKVNLIKLKNTNKLFVVKEVVIRGSRPEEIQRTKAIV